MIGFVTGNETNYDSTVDKDKLFLATDTKQLILNGISYIPKMLSEMTNDMGYITNTDAEIARYAYGADGISYSAVGYGLTTQGAAVNGGMISAIYNKTGLYGCQINGDYSGQYLYFRGLNNGAATEWKQIALVDGTVANANNLSGMAVSALPNYWNTSYKSIDLQTLDQDTWYPCVMTLSDKYPNRIRIWSTLGNSPAPDWATHTSGFTLNLEWSAVGSAWGSTSQQRTIHNYKVAFTVDGISPCGGIEQNTYQSIEVVWLRGGGLYYYQSDSNNSFVLYEDGYSWTNSAGTATYEAPLRTASTIVSPLLSRSGSLLSVSDVYADTVTTSGKATIGGALYLGGSVLMENNQTIYMKNTAGTNCTVLNISTADVLAFGYGTSVQGHKTLIYGAGLSLNYYDGSSLNEGLSISTSGAVGIKKTLTVAGATTLNGAVYLRKHAILSNNQYIYVVDTDGNSKGAMFLNNSNAFVLGYGTSKAGYSTYIDGCGTYFRYYDGTDLLLGMSLNASGNVTVKNALFVNGSLTVPSLKIGDATITYDSTCGMLKIDKGMYSNGAVSAKGADSGASVLSSVAQFAVIYQGSEWAVVGTTGVTTYGDTASVVYDYVNPSNGGTLAIQCDAFVGCKYGDVGISPIIFDASVDSTATLIPYKITDNVLYCKLFFTGSAPSDSFGFKIIVYK